MEQILFNERSTDVAQFLDITEDRKQQLLVLIKRAADSVEFDENGKRRNVVSTESYLKAFVEIGKNIQEVVLCAFIAGGKCQKLKEQNLCIPKGMFSDMPSELKEMLAEAFK